MFLDVQKLQEEVSETRLMVQELLQWKNQLDILPIQAEETPLTVQQAAELLDVTTATVYDLVHKRRIPSHRPGKRLYFLRSELMQWIKDGRRSTVQELSTSASTRQTRQSRKSIGKAA